MIASPQSVFYLSSQHWTHISGTLQLYVLDDIKPKMAFPQGHLLLLSLFLLRDHHPPKHLHSEFQSIVDASPPSLLPCTIIISSPSILGPHSHSSHPHPSPCPPQSWWGHSSCLCVLSVHSLHLEPSCMWPPINLPNIVYVIQTLFSLILSPCR